MIISKCTPYDYLSFVPLLGNKCFHTKLLTAEYVKLNLAKAISQNTKYYFSGEKGIVSGLLSKIMD